MKARDKARGTARRAAPAALFVLAAVFLAAFTGCQKTPISPDASLLERPIIWLNADAFTFQGSESGPLPTPQEIRVKNSGKNALKYEISDDAPWLSIDPVEGSSTGQTNSHAITVDTGGLTGQDAAYTATITVTSSDAYNNPQKITVALRLSKEPPPEIAVSPEAMLFAAQAGGSNPAAQTLTVKNNYKSVLNYAISDDASWLSVEPAGGSSSGEARSHAVTVNTAGLSAGAYAAAIIVSDPKATNSPRQVAVTLQLSSEPPPPPPMGNNEIYVSCSPTQGGAGATVSFPIGISGNAKAISSFGLQLSYDPAMFQYVGTAKGSLTGGWTYVDGNDSGGSVTVGGFSGSGGSVAVGSAGTIAVVSLRVTGGSYGDGQTSVVSIRSYADDISGMTPHPATTTFTLRK